MFHIRVREYIRESAGVYLIWNIAVGLDASFLIIKVTGQEPAALTSVWHGLLREIYLERMPVLKYYDVCPLYAPLGGLARPLDLVVQYTLS